MSDDRSDDNTERNEDERQQDAPKPSEPVTQEIHHSQVSALVPEKVGRGSFSTGAVVLNGPHEFIIDFLLRMTKPHQVSARVIIPPGVVPRFIGALQENLDNYKRRFGEPLQPQASSPSSGSPVGASGAEAQTQPKVEAGQQPGQVSQLQQSSAQDLYDQLKISDDEISGTYANAVMIGHTATEFSFDFITTFFPRSSVAKRVYLAAPNVPRLLDSLKHSFEQFQRKMASPRQNPPPPPEPPVEPAF